MKTPPGVWMVRNPGPGGALVTEKLARDETACCSDPHCDGCDVLSHVVVDGLIEPVRGRRP